MDIYNTITTTVLRELESGRLSGRTRWKTTGLPLRWNGNKGEKATAIVYGTHIDKKNTDENDDAI